MEINRSKFLKSSQKVKSSSKVSAKETCHPREPRSGEARSKGGGVGRDTSQQVKYKSVGEEITKQPTPTSPTEHKPQDRATTVATREHGPGAARRTRRGVRGRALRCLRHCGLRSTGDNTCPMAADPTWISQPQALKVSCAT